MVPDTTGRLRRAIRRVRRPGVSGRVLGTTLLPLLLLATVSVSITVDRHDDAVVAGRIADGAEMLEDLVALRSSMLTERLVEEVSSPDQRPPRQLIETSEFLLLAIDNPERVRSSTDQALFALDPADRPFTPVELAAVRGDEVVGGFGGATGARWEPLMGPLLESMLGRIAELRSDAILLGNPALARAIDNLDEAIEVPIWTGDLLGQISAFWMSPTGDRAQFQSELAALDAGFEDTSNRLERSLDPTIRALWAERGAMPQGIEQSIAIGLDGTLTDPERPPGEPPLVGLALIDGLDWAISVDEVPTAVTGIVRSQAAEVAASARTGERTTTVLTLVAILASVAAALLFGRSIVASVKRLTDQAILVGQGDLNLEPLELSGPPEVVRASAAFNDVVDNLVLLERKTRALADCDFDDESLARPLPGMLGASLQRSVRVLSGSIIERQQLQQRLVHQANHDTLTGLANRAKLVSVLTDAHRDRRCSESDERIAVVFVDLDGFKSINDRFGHAVGDELLRVVASRLRASVRRDVLVARLGGDEFVLVMPSVKDWQEPVSVARRIVRSLSELVEVEGHWVRVGASAGVALCDTPPTEDRGPLDLLRRADLAVYTAKHRSGEHVAIYDDEMDRMVVNQQDIEEGLSQALRDDEGLTLVFQPIIDALTGSATGIESLVRWERRGKGSVSPAVFVPIAERSGLVVELDLWVLEHALAQLSAWSDEPTVRRLEISVNVSGRSLLDPTFVEDCLRLLAESGVDPRRLVFEVTETALVTDLDLAATQLQLLRSRGVRISIDDFGTGYTSVAHLRTLPIDQIKIDSSFVQSLPEREHYLLIQMINELARRMDVPTVAEGVESSMQVDALREIGCDHLQGYLFAHPMPPSDLLKWLSVESGGRIPTSVTERV